RPMPNCRAWRNSCPRQQPRCTPRHSASRCRPQQSAPSDFPHGFMLQFALDFVPVALQFIAGEALSATDKTPLDHANRDRAILPKPAINGRAGLVAAERLARCVFRPDLG